MPDKVNRRIADHLSNHLFCPTQTAIDNLARVGVTTILHLVGDVMVDALEFSHDIAEEKSGIIQRWLSDNTYQFLTIHRAANTDSKKNLETLLSATGETGRLTFFPVHPSKELASRLWIMGGSPIQGME